jgi:hypothetical protein
MEPGLDVRPISAQGRTQVIQSHTPIVATTLNSPLAIRSISASISCSADDGELRIVYDDRGFGSGDPVWVGGAGGGGGGRREKREGEGEMKERYWSTTWLVDILGENGICIRGPQYELVRRARRCRLLLQMRLVLLEVIVGGALRS